MANKTRILIYSDCTDLALQTRDQLNGNCFLIFRNEYRTLHLSPIHHLTISCTQMKENILCLVRSVHYLLFLL